MEADVNEERPAWLPKNFKDGPALVKSYKEAMRKIAELGAEARDRQHQIEAIRAAVERVERQAADGS